MPMGMKRLTPAEELAKRELVEAGVRRPTKQEIIIASIPWTDEERASEDARRELLRGWTDLLIRHREAVDRGDHEAARALMGEALDHLDSLGPAARQPTLREQRLGVNYEKCLARPRKRR